MLVMMVIEWRAAWQDKPALDAACVRDFHLRGSAKAINRQGYLTDYQLSRSQAGGPVRGLMFSHCGSVRAITTPDQRHEKTAARFGYVKLQPSVAAMRRFTRLRHENGGLQLRAGMLPGEVASAFRHQRSRSSVYIFRQRLVRGMTPRMSLYAVSKRSRWSCRHATLFAYLPVCR